MGAMLLEISSRLVRLCSEEDCFLSDERIPPVRNTSLYTRRITMLEKDYRP